MPLTTAREDGGTMLITGTSALLILHALVGVALLGAITHQVVSLYLKRGGPRGTTFLGRYSSVNTQTFVLAIVAIYVLQVILGAIVYPSYRVNVRPDFEDLYLFKGVGSFEVKEHLAGIGMALLPLYYWLWRPDVAETHRIDRAVITSLLAFVVWWGFLVGEVLNNIRGLA